jgi:hypothetical protein
LLLMMSSKVIDKTNINVYFGGIITYLER